MFNMKIENYKVYVIFRSQLSAEKKLNNMPINLAQKKKVNPLTITVYF